MISTLRLLKIWLKGGIPTIEKYERKVTQSPSWEELYAVDFREAGVSLDSKAWTLTKRKAALEGLYGQYEQYDVPVPEHVTVKREGLSLLAAPASVEGIQWHRTYGFVKASCTCAGAYVSSLQNLNIKTGKILMRAHWKDCGDFVVSAALESERKYPLVEILTLSKRWSFGYCDKKTRKEVILPKFLLKEGASYVFELRWTDRDMRWKVNGMELFRVKRRFPGDLYFSATVALIKKLQTVTPGGLVIESFRVLERHRRQK